MPRRKGLVQTLRTLLKDYTERSSLHGFCYLYKSTSCFAVFVWATVIACGTVLCAVLGLMIFKNFINNPTLTVVESTHFSMSEIPFPAVAVCDPKIVYGSNSENITKILERRGYNGMQINEFYRSITDVKEIGYTPQPYITKMHDLLDDLGVTYSKLLDMMKRPCDELLVECFWRSKQYNCSDMFRSVFTFTGYCCQFDMEYFKGFVEESTTFVSGIEITEALEIIVNVREQERNELATNGYVQLYIFDRENILTFLDRSVTLTPYAYFDISVDAWLITASDYVKELSVESRKCILETDVTYGAGFYHGCLVTNIMRRVVDSCRCIPFDYSSYQLETHVDSKCTWNRLLCIYENLEKVLGDAKTVIAESECYQRCDYLQYEISLKYLQDQRDTNGSSDSFSKISIHFDDTTCMKYRREVLYTWDQMLANLGGIFGLCLGGSIISIIEIIWLILDVIYAVVVNWATKKVSPYRKKWQRDLVLKLPTVPVKNNKVFIPKYKFTN